VNEKTWRLEKECRVFSLGETLPANQSSMKYGLINGRMPALAFSETTLFLA
jgi:hypothetical protein